MNYTWYVNKILLRFVPLFILLLILTSCLFETSPTPPGVIDGYLDLSTWNFEKDGIIDLNGAWEFYWNHFLESSDFKENNNSSVKDFIQVPDTWDSTGLEDEFRRKGFATYRLQVHLGPDNIGKLAFKILDISTASKVFVNGIEVYSSGVTGLTKNTTVPGYSPGIANFETSIEDIEIIINVSNFYHRIGGIWEPISIGLAEDIYRRTRTSYYYIIFLSSILLVFCFFYLILYITNSTDKKILFLGIFSFFLLIRGISSGEKIILHIFPYLQWEFYSRIEYLSLYLSIAFFMGILRVSFPEEINKTVTKIIFIYLLLVSFIAFIFPVGISSYLLSSVHIVAFLGANYGLLRLISAVRKKRKGSIIFLTGFLIIFAFLINDILYARLIIESTYLSPLAFVLFVFVQTFELAYIISQSFELIKSQNKELNNYKGHLEELVSERTLDLETALHTVEESSRAKSDFLSNMSHELRTPLTHIIGFSELVLMKDNLMNSDPEAKEFMNDVLSSGKHLLGLISGILDLAKNKAGKQKLQITRIDLGKLLHESLDIFSKQHVDLNFVLIPGIPETLNGDYLKIKQILYNLLSNAVKFSPSGGKISVEVYLKSEGTTFCIKDEGIGIKKENHERIFASFEQIESGAERLYGGTGLGLALVTDFVSLHGGKAWAESRGEGMGSEFYFIIPLEIIF
jgi:signal transduction histidine kinase